MWKCKNCGNTNKTDGNFCEYCGSRAENSKVPEDSFTGSRRPKKTKKRVLAVILAIAVAFAIASPFLYRLVSGKSGTQVVEHFDEKTRTLSCSGDFPEDTLYMRVPEEKDILNGENEDGLSFEYIDRELIIVSARNVTFSGMESLLNRHGLDITGYIADCDTYQARSRSSLSLSDLNVILESLSAEPEVEFVSLNVVTHAEPDDYRLPNDPWADGTVSEHSVGGSNWGVEAVRAPWFWQNYKLEGVHAGVVDNMFKDPHEDLKYAGTFQNRYEYHGEYPNSGHGTHVSGIIGASYSNGKGISGVLKEPRLYATSFPNGNNLDYIFVIDLMLKNGAKVINISLGYKPEMFDSLEEYRSAARDNAERLTPPLERMLENGKDFILVNSAGNNGRYKDYSDAEYNYWTTAITSSALRSRIVVVGAAKEGVISGYDITDFSDRGDRLDVMAPGLLIYSCWDSEKSGISREYKYENGTSMAAPFATAACAALWEYYPSLSGADIKTLLVKTADINVRGTDAKMIDLRAAFGGYSEGVVRNHKTITLEELLSLEGYGGTLRPYSLPLSPSPSPSPSPSQAPVPTIMPSAEPVPSPAPEPAPSRNYIELYDEFVQSTGWSELLYYAGTSGLTGYYYSYDSMHDDIYRPQNGSVCTGRYFISDIDGNGIPELIMCGGISIAESFIAVFKFEDGVIRFVMFVTTAYDAGIAVNRETGELFVGVYHGGSVSNTIYVISDGMLNYSYETGSMPEGFVQLPDPDVWGIDPWTRAPLA